MLRLFSFPLKTILCTSTPQKPKLTQNFHKKFRMKLFQNFIAILHNKHFPHLCKMLTFISEIIFNLPDILDFEIQQKESFFQVREFKE